LSSHAADETVFYCVVDQLVGIQESKESSGKIKAPVERFTLKYKPAKILDSPSSKSKDLSYVVPQLATSFGNKDGSVSTYTYNDLVAPFNSGWRKAATLSDSKGRDVTEEDRDELRGAVAKSKEGPMTGAYMNDFHFFRIRSIQIVKTDGGLNGVFHESYLYIPDVKQDKYRGFLSYIYQFSCQPF
jgi:hypothetical protein